MCGLIITGVGTLLSHASGLHGTRPLEVFSSSEHCSSFIPSMVATTAIPWQRPFYICWTMPASRHRYILLFNGYLIKGLMKGWQVGHWTLDNAANNSTFMEELAELLQARDINFDAADRCMMCFPHVINICWQHVITAFTNPALASSVVDFVAESHQGPVDQQTFETAVKQDPVTLGCNIVCALQSSGQRHDAFDDLVRDSNEKGWF